MSFTLVVNPDVLGLVEPVLDEKLSAIVEAIASDARGYAAVDTGYMRDHIVTEKSGPRTYSVISQASYSIYQEFGTYKMPAHPFMRPALYKNRAI
jgi:HK97 gp10 family phage protein